MKATDKTILISYASSLEEMQPLRHSVKRYYKGNVHYSTVHKNQAELIEHAIQQRYRYILYIHNKYMVKEDIQKIWEIIDLRGYFLLRAPGRSKDYHPVNTDIIGFRCNNFMAVKFWDIFYEAIVVDGVPAEDAVMDTIDIINTQQFAKVSLVNENGYTIPNDIGKQIFHLK